MVEVTGQPKRVDLASWAHIAVEKRQFIFRVALLPLPHGTLGIH
jgi:hypothetical protein